MTDLITKANSLTPIEEYDGVYYKRDDLFHPFSNEMLNGGKVRQAINLIHYNLNLIRSRYNNTVATTCQKNSPQGLIISRIVREYDLNCFVAYGNINQKTLEENLLIQHIRKNNGIVESIINQGYDNAITSKLKQLQQSGKGNNFFIIKFGIDTDLNHFVVDCISDQVKNIPDKIDNLVIPTGSGITAGAILKGLRLYHKEVKNDYVVHVSGEDRTKRINEIAGMELYIYVKGTGYKYNNKLARTVPNGFELDEVYEAKVYDWMIHNLDLRREKTLFWCVGNFNFYR